MHPRIITILLEIEVASVPDITLNRTKSHTSLPLLWSCLFLICTVSLLIVTPLATVVSVVISSHIRTSLLCLPVHIQSNPINNLFDRLKNAYICAVSISEFHICFMCGTNPSAESKMIISCHFVWKPNLIPKFPLVSGVIRNFPVHTLFIIRSSPHNKWQIASQIIYRDKTNQSLPTLSDLTDPKGIL